MPSENRNCAKTLSRFKHLADWPRHHRRRAKVELARCGRHARRARHYATSSVTGQGTSSTILKGQLRRARPSPRETMPPSFPFSVDGKRESGHKDRNPAAAHAEPELQGASSGLGVWCDASWEKGGPSSIIRPQAKAEGKPRRSSLQVRQLLKEASRNYSRDHTRLTLKTPAGLLLRCPAGNRRAAAASKQASWMRSEKLVPPEVLYFSTGFSPGRVIPRMSSCTPACVRQGDQRVNKQQVWTSTWSRNPG